MTNQKNKKIIKKSNAIYDNVAEKYGVSSRSVCWDDPQTQYLRFFELIKNLGVLEAEGSVLDVGCGNAELYKFLNFVGFRGRYTGYDINAKLLKQATQRFGKSIQVKQKDILDGKSGVQKHDYVLMSGLFNKNVGQDVPWIEKFLKKMFGLCRIAMSFNAISTHVNYKEKEMFYLGPEEILRFCINNLSQRVVLSHHHLPYNYTVTVFRNNVWKSIS